MQRSIVNTIGCAETRFVLLAIVTEQPRLFTQCVGFYPRQLFREKMCRWWTNDDWLQGLKGS
ncbi:unnamed protein product [Periconia digitata]|uniref:Uncharacterized protein n=1 Tax=Periconia digitata TaxID=1303443 RepID=A0A9W4XMT7_9PLEO|nr:unnamed protein product [Periconia digitata]